MDLYPVASKLLNNLPTVRQHSIQRAARSATRKANHQYECKARLELLTAGGDLTFDLEEEFEALFEYKNRPLTARLLHFSLWLSNHHREEDASSVRIVLQAHADLSAQARYPGRENSQIGLECIHIAAGLGHVPAMQALLDWHPLLEWDSDQLLDRFCTIDAQQFYAPIHDAAFLGRKDAVLWLLENDADATLANKDGFTALHWAALNGLEGFQSKDELKTVVLSLVEHKAKLNVKTFFNGPDTRKRGLIPLEMAAMHESHFPKELMYLLAPSLQLDEGRSHDNLFDSQGTPGTVSFACIRGSSFLTDLCVLSGHHRTAALKLAQQLKNSPRLHNRLRAASQDEGVADLVAHLFHTVPLAAADFLDILLVQPEIQDPGHHPINTRTSFSGFFQSVNMRCAYQTDATEKEVGGRVLSWPEWKCDASENWPEWHGDLVRAPDKRHEASIWEHDAETKVLLLPNVINVNVLMALAHTTTVNKQVFANITVQGIISQVWNGLMERILSVSLFFELVEFLVLVHWGLAPVCLHFEMCEADTEAHLSSTSASIHWSIACAGFLREVINLFWGLFAYIRQWNFCRQEPGSLHELYQPRKYFAISGALGHLLLNALKAAFLWSSFDSGGVPLSGQARALLAISMALQGWKLIYKLRVVVVGANKLLLFAHTFVSGSMRETMSISFLVYVSFVFIYLVIRHEHGRWNWAALHLYRTLIIGDGESLDSIGMSTEEEEPLLTGFMILGTAIFNIVIMNLFIAIFTTQYGQLEGDSELLFQQERACLACRSVLQHQKLQHFGFPERRGTWLLLKTLAFAAFSLSIVLFVMPEEHWRGIPAGLLAFAEVLCQALCMHSDWFPCQGALLRPWIPDSLHFLWVTYRADMPEAVPDPAVTYQAEASTAMKHLQKRVDKMDDKIDNLAGDISKLISSLEGSAMQKSRSRSRSQYAM